MRVLCSWLQTARLVHGLDEVLEADAAAAEAAAAKGGAGKASVRRASDIRKGSLIRRRDLNASEGTSLSASQLHLGMSTTGAPAGSSSAALGVWNQATIEVQRATQLDALSLQLETARISTDRWLQSDAAASVVIDSSSRDCRFNTEALEVAVAEHLPLGPELSSRWSADPQGLGQAGLSDRLCLIATTGPQSVRVWPRALCRLSASACLGHAPR